MDQEPEVIRRNIDVTRSALTEKLETLECQVKGTMDDARSTVEDTLHSVRSTVDDTIAAVKRTFDLRYQTELHPWPMVGASVAAGLVAGAVLSRQLFAETPATHASGIREPFAPSAPAREPAGPGIMERLKSEFSGEIQQVKSMAISTLFGVLRDSLKRAVPPNFQPQVEHLMNDLTTRLGGEPVEGPVLEPTGGTEMGGGRRW